MLCLAPFAAGCGLLVGIEDPRYSPSDASISSSAGAGGAMTDRDASLDQREAGMGGAPDAFTDDASKVDAVSDRRTIGEDAELGDAASEAGDAASEAGDAASDAPEFDDWILAEAAGDARDGSSVDGSIPDPVGMLVRVSVSTGGTEANGPSDHPAVSGDGRRIVFWSAADNLVPMDMNGVGDVFLHQLGDERTAGLTLRISVLASGTEANAECYDPDIGPDGNAVVFTSAASTLTQVPPPTQHVLERFVEGRVFRDVSPTVEEETFSGAASALGANYAVAWVTAADLVPADKNAKRDVYVSGQNGTELVSAVDGVPEDTAGNDASDNPRISANGNVVAFESLAGDLVRPDLVRPDNNGVSDIFVRLRAPNAKYRTLRVSVDDQGAEGDGPSHEPAISADGRWVAFSSAAKNLARSQTDNNGVVDVFVHDLMTHVTRRVSVASDGTEADRPSFSPSLSADGRVVAFLSSSSVLVRGNRRRSADAGDELNVFVRDLVTGQTTLLTRPFIDTVGSLGDCGRPMISGNGRVVVFSSNRSDLLATNQNRVRDVFAYVFSSAPWLQSPADQ